MTKRGILLAEYLVGSDRDIKLTAKDDQVPPVAVNISTATSIRFTAITRTTGAVLKAGTPTNSPDITFFTDGIDGIYVVRLAPADMADGDAGPVEWESEITKDSNVLAVGEGVLPVFASKF